MRTIERLRLAASAACLCMGVAQAQTLPAPPVSPAPVVDYEYDAQGNPTKTTQAKGVANFNFETKASYDRLDRRKDTTDAKAGITRFGYDGLDRPLQVTDPRNLITQSPRSGLGEVKQLISPDTGTATLTYDAAGNLKTRTDSRGVLTTYTYDALNRPSAAVHSQTGATNLNFAWLYDQVGTGFAHGVGRLTTSQYPGGNAVYSYDPQGRLTKQVVTLWAATGVNNQVTPTVSYGYDSSGHLTSLTYPSGRKLSVTYTAGQATAVGLAKDAASTASPLISQIQYTPFGPPKSWLWQLATGTQAHTRVFDTSGRLVRYRLGNSIRDLTYDAADRIKAYTHYDATSAAAQPTLNQSFDYDQLGRLTHVTLNAGYWDFGYDANGNRTSATASGTIRSYTTATTSNRLTNISNPSRGFVYDNAGNTTSDTQYSATYDLSGRLATLTKGGVTSTYTYNAAGQRVRKASSAGVTGTVVFVYDQDGQLLGEYDSTGKAIREYVWLGSTPIAVFTPDPANATNPPLVYFIHADHLNTPRVVVDKNNKARWQWLAEPFGVTAPNTNPSSLGAFTFNLRFPGQYFDQESGLHYNWHRYYDPTNGGRYTQSDPIGLAGGINTYAYVSGNPLMYVDPNGLWAIGDPLPQGLLDFGAGFGDVVTFGISRHMRDLMDIGSVDRCSNWYTTGEVAGVVATTATGFVGGTRWFARQASPNNWSNFSHSGTPASWQRGSWWSRTGNRANGDYIPTTGTRPDLHDLMDATAAGVGGRYPTWPAWRRLINRMPYTPGGALYGGASAAMNDCECSK